MAVILSDTMSRAVVASSSRPGLIFRPGQAGDWLRKSDTYLIKHNCEDAESAPLAPSFGVDYAFRVRGSGHLQVLQRQTAARHGASGGFKGGLMMCWVLGLFWRGFIGWQMLARVQDWWLVDFFLIFSHQNAISTCTRLLQLEDCSGAVYEVYTQHMFSRASYRSRLEIKELHLPGAYPAREPECERVEVVLHV